MVPSVLQCASTRLLKSGSMQLLEAQMTVLPQVWRSEVVLNVRASARRPPQVDYVLLFGPTERGKIWHAIFPAF